MPEQIIMREKRCKLNKSFTQGNKGNNSCQTFHKTHAVQPIMQYG